MSLLKDIEKAIKIIKSSRATHVAWANYLKKRKLPNEMLGGRRFHLNCIKRYDFVIRILTEIKKSY